jgi:DNA-binding GntR family transcriptional regulator
MAVSDRGAGPNRRGSSGRERAYDFVKNSVLTDPANQGQFVSEQEVAARIGVSRTPIREALLMLSAEGLVQLVPNRGAYIAPLTGKELRELVELRGLLERFAAEKTIGNGTVPLGAMRTLLEQQGRLEGPDDAEEFIGCDAAFHQVLIDAAGSELLSRTYRGLRARQVRAGLVALFHEPARQSAVLSEHAEILGALADSDAARAVAAIDDHLETTLRIQLTS